MENKQTAVEWLIDKLTYKNDLGYLFIELRGDASIREIVEQAKQMEREQIEETFDKAQIIADVDCDGNVTFMYENGSDYFTKKYQNGKDT